MFDPYLLKEGESLRLLNEVFLYRHIPLSQIMSCAAVADMEIEDHLDECGKDALYLNNRSCLPSIYLNQVECIQQGKVCTPQQLNKGLELKVVTALGESINVQPPLPFAPSKLALLIDMASIALVNWIEEHRPWQIGIVSTRYHTQSSLHLDRCFQQVLIQPDLYTLINSYPTRIISVTKDAGGLMINIHCDIRVYLWTKQQERLYQP